MLSTPSAPRPAAICDTTCNISSPEGEGLVFPEELFELRARRRFGEREVFERVLSGGGGGVPDADDDEDEYDESSDILLKSRGYKALCILATMGASFGSDVRLSKPNFSSLVIQLIQRLRRPLVFPQSNFWDTVYVS
jgi:hypothetical protein